MVHVTARRTFITGTLGGLGVAALTACASEASSSDQSKPLSKSNPASIVVGVLPISTVAPVYAAQAQGFFEEAGLTVSIKTAAGAPQLTAAIEGGSYHFGYTAPTPFLLAASQGVGVTAVAANDVDDKKHPMNQILVGPKSSISSPADLAGATVAVNTLGGILQATVMSTIQNSGGDPSTVKFIPLPFQQMLTALSQGRVDAVVATEPFVTQGLAQGNTSVGNPIHEALPEGVNGIWYTTSDYAKEHEQEVAAFRTAVEQGLAYVNDHPEEARALVEEFTKIPPKTVESMTMPAWATKDTGVDVLEKTFNDQVAMLEDYKMLKGKVDTSALIWDQV